MIKLINPAKMKMPYEPPTTAVILDDLTDAPESTNEDQVEFLNAVRDGNESMVRPRPMHHHLPRCIMTMTP